MKEDARAITGKLRQLPRRVMRSSASPSAKMLCSGSPLRFSKGSTAMAGRPARPAVWSGEGLWYHQPRIANRATAIDAVTPVPTQRGTVLAGLVSAETSSAAWTDAALGYRPPTSFVRHRATTVRTPVGARSDGKVGESLNIDEARSAPVAPPNGNRPLAISDSSTPNDQMSLLVVAASPRSTSGAM